VLYVTGITGHSGRWFLKKLSDEGFKGKIRCVMRESRESAPIKYSVFNKYNNLDLEFVVGDLNDSEFLISSLKGVSIIVHIASITYSKEIIDAAIFNNVDWAILVHTTGRYSKYKSASQGYIAIEDEVLRMCDNSGTNQSKLNCTIIRPTMIYGSSGDRNMYRLIDYLYHHRFFPLFGDGSNLMQPVHARDLGNAYYDILMRPSKTMNQEYNLSGKNPISYFEVINTIRNQLNCKIRIIKIPISLSVFAAKIYNTFFKNAIITVEQVLRMKEDKAFSHEDAVHDFNYNPLSFEEGIQEEVIEYLQGVSVDFSNIRYE